MSNRLSPLMLGLYLATTKCGGEVNQEEQKEQSTKCTIIHDESDGRAFILEELAARSYQTIETNDGTWRVYLYNSETREYDLALEPDIRFTRHETPGYHYLEFDSSEDPGVEHTSELPFYREIRPACSADLKKNLADVLGE